jgi:hypothetical protein
MNRGRSILFTLVLAFTTIASVGSAHAYQPAADALDVSGTAFLEMFPCPVLTVCQGSFHGSVNGNLSGVDGGVPWSVVVTAGPGGSTFLYNDSCPEPIGFATGSGTFTASAGGAPIGTYGPDPNGPPSLPLPIIALEEPFTFSWTRVGATASLMLSSTTRVQILRPGVGPEWRTVATGRPGLGNAAFAPTDGGIPTCEAPAPLTAFVVSVDTYTY